MNKLMTYAALLGAGYVALNVFIFWLNAKARETKKQRTYKTKKQKTNRATQEPREKICYDAVMANTNKPKQYLEAKELFNSCIKNKLMTREQVLYLKQIINECIPVEHMKLYKIKYKNDAHEIYSKMKSSFIDENTYQRIIEYLSMIQSS